MQMMQLRGLKTGVYRKTGTEVQTIQERIEKQRYNEDGTDRSDEIEVDLSGYNGTGKTYKWN